MPRSSTCRGVSGHDVVRLNPPSFKVVKSDNMPTVANEPTFAEPVLGEPPRDPTVGDVLRETREATGQQLRDIARLLRIRYDYLQAIEDDRLEILPGATYAVGFVRAYAQHLELDADRLLTRFRAEMGGLGEAKDLVFPAAPPDGKFPGGALIAISLVLIVGAFAGWYYVSNQDGPTFDRVFAPEIAAVYEPPAEESPATGLQPEPVAATPVPEPATEPQRVAREPELAAAPATEPASAPSSPATNAERVPATVVDAPTPVVEPVPERVAAAPTPEPPVVPAPEGAPLQPIAAAEAATPRIAALPAVPESTTISGDGRVYGRPNRDARIIVTAVDDSWIQIDDGGQTVVFTRMLAAGDSYRVPNRGGLRLKTGNAGGLTISVDSVDVPPIGVRGEILQNVVLDPVLLQGGRASAP